MAEPEEIAVVCAMDEDRLIVPANELVLEVMMLEDWLVDSTATEVMSEEETIPDGCKLLGIDMEGLSELAGEDWPLSDDTALVAEDAVMLYCPVGAADWEDDVGFILSLIHI